MPETPDPRFYIEFQPPAQTLPTPTDCVLALLETCQGAIEQIDADECEREQKAPVVEASATVPIEGWSVIVTLKFEFVAAEQVVGHG